MGIDPKLYFCDNFRTKEGPRPIGFLDREAPACALFDSSEFSGPARSPTRATPGWRDFSPGARAQERRPVKSNDPVTEMGVVGSNEKVTERAGHFLLSVN
jgi:hypothetical protein